MFLLTKPVLSSTGCLKLNYATITHARKTNTRAIFLTAARLIKCIHTTERLETASSSLGCGSTVKPPHQYVFTPLSAPQPGSSSAVFLSDHKGGTTPRCLLASRRGPSQTSGCTFYANSCTFSLLAS